MKSCTGTVLDAVLSNFNENLTDKGVTEPIRSDDGTLTDHRTVFASFRMPRVPSYSLEKYSYRHLTEEGYLKFGRWIEAYDWTGLQAAQSANEATELLHKAFEDGVNQSYEHKTRKKKSCEPAWMTD